MSDQTRTLIEAVDSWALPYFAHRDEMNVNLHTSIDIKWSEVTKQLALGLIVAGESGYWQNKVMYAVWREFLVDREAVEMGQASEFTPEERRAIEAWAEETW